MHASVLEAVLEKLKSEGVTAIRVVSFAGRGDPLANRHLDDLIRLSKRHFPSTVAMVTTHASYPYQPKIVTSGLNVFRVSIDGAFPENYAKYRVGGDLERALDFLRRLRHDRWRLSVPMQVVWKYILFEWNDGDDELRYAARLAEDVGARLDLVITHGRGRSRRLANVAAVSEHIRKLGINAHAGESTFPLKAGQSNGLETEAVAAEFSRESFRLALAHIKAQRHADAFECLARGLAADPGLEDVRDFGAETIRRYCDVVVKQARFTSTLSWLAAVSAAWNDRQSNLLLLKRYLELAPNAPNSEHVLTDLAAQWRAVFGEQGAPVPLTAARPPSI
jgi:hypothetical protein